MSDLIDDIIEDAKQEKLRRILIASAKYIISVVLLCLIAVLLWTWWDSHRKNQIYSEAAEYLRAQHLIQRVQTKDELSGIVKQLEAISKGNTIYSVLASLDLASIYSVTNDFNKAIYHYKMIASNNGVDKGLRSFASIMEIACNIRAEKITAEEGLQSINKHQEMYNSFQHSKELLQISMLIEAGKKEEARAVIENIRSTVKNDELIYALAELLLVLTVS